jgi:hypothetical protein
MAVVHHKIVVSTYNIISIAVTGCSLLLTVPHFWLVLLSYIQLRWARTSWAPGGGLLDSA